MENKVFGIPTAIIGLVLSIVILVDAPVIAVELWRSHQEPKQVVEKIQQAPLPTPVKTATPSATAKVTASSSARLKGGR